MFKLIYLKLKLYRLQKKHNKLCDKEIYLQIKKLEGEIYVAERRHIYNQSTFVYCPCCNQELIGSISLFEDPYESKTIRDRNGDSAKLVKITCERCGVVSLWDFDAPAPILMREGEE